MTNLKNNYSKKLEDYIKRLTLKSLRAIEV